MLIHLTNYSGGYRIVSLAISNDALNDMKNQELPFAYFNGSSLQFYPEKNIVVLSDIAIQKFRYCNDYDVLEISPDGVIYQYYNCASLDNAFVITEKCNSNCIMCPTPESVRKKGTTYTIEKLLEIVKHIPSDAVHFTITGGEPFILGRDIFRFFAALKDKFIETEFLLLTNGRVFCSATYCNELKKTLPHNTLIGIPLHGYDAKTHDSITQTDGSFEQTLMGIKRLLVIGEKIELRIVVNQYTVEYFDKLTSLIVDQLSGVHSVKIMGMEMLGNAAINASRLWIDYSVAGKIIESSIIKLVENEIDVALYNFPLCTVPKSLWNICRKSISDYKIRYGDGCEECLVKDACGGIFVGSLRFVKNDIYPVKGV